MTNHQDSTSMKKYFIHLFIGFMALGQSAIAQKELDRANSYFERAFYSDAIPLYEAMLAKRKSKKMVSNLAEAYYRTYNMNASARWYAYLIENYGSDEDYDHYFKLHHSLKAIGNYEKAHQLLQEYYQKKNDSVQAKAVQNQATYLSNVEAIGDRFSIDNLVLNTVTSEFGAIAIDSNLVYTASKKEGTSAQKLYRWNNQKYLDIYTHPLSQLTMGDSISQSLSKTVNTKMHEGTFAISKDRKTIYFTRNNFNKGRKRKDDNKVTNLKIYRATWSGETWGAVEELPFNSDDFSTEHPALSSDENLLYFASDRPGGHGSFDLYKIAIREDGSFGNPINLGSTINTEKKEQFPYIAKNGTLYFASDGHAGFGLLDIFIATAIDGSFSKPDNIGLPVNSGYDDFSISFDAEQPQKGYFSSNRPTGKGSDDIYSFEITKPLIIEDCQQFIEGILIDKTTKQPIAEGKVTLRNVDGTILNELITNQDATFRFPIDCGLSLNLQASKSGYQESFKNIQGSDERNKVHDGTLELLSQQEIEKQEQLVEQRKKEQERIQAEREKERALVQAEKVKEKLQKEKKERIAKAIKKENAIVKEKNKTVIKTEEIHFDYSLWYLRRESRERLGVVVKTMKNQPTITIEIGTHTDIRGNASYNKELSQKRADAVKEFLVKNDIAANRILAKGYGESQPLVKCETEESCSEEDHEWNRRCEFTIVNWE